MYESGKNKDEAALISSLNAVDGIPPRSIETGRIGEIPALVLIEINSFKFFLFE